MQQMQQHTLHYLSESNKSIIDNNQTEILLKRIKKIKQIACGYHHIIILDDLNNIYTCGWNKNGQLGLGNRIDSNYFKQINDFNNQVKLICASGFFTVVVTLQNNIYGTGSTTSTSLYGSTDIFTKILNNNTHMLDNHVITKIKCGEQFIIFLNNYNQLFGANCNFLTTKTHTFEKIILPNYNHNIFTNYIIDFNCGNNYVTILTKSGDVYYSKIGFFNLSEESDTCRFVKFRKIKFNQFNYCEQIACLDNTLFYLTNNNNNCQLYNNCYREFKFDKKIKQIYSGFTSNLYCLTDNNEIYKLEKNKFKKVSEVNEWKLPYLSIVVGFDFIIVLNTNYKVGNNDIYYNDCNEMKKMKYLLFKQFKTKNNFGDILIFF